MRSEMKPNSQYYVVEQQHFEKGPIVQILYFIGVHLVVAPVCIRCPTCALQALVAALDPNKIAKQNRRREVAHAKLRIVVAAMHYFKMQLGY